MLGRLAHLVANRQFVRLRNFALCRPRNGPKWIECLPRKSNSQNVARLRGSAIDREYSFNLRHRRRVLSGGKSISRTRFAIELNVLTVRPQLRILPNGRWQKWSVTREGTYSPKINFCFSSGEGRNWRERAWIRTLRLLSTLAHGQS